jgi:hypothetical protein
MKTQIKNTKGRELLVSILKQPFAWPGGYERLLVTTDGALLCSQCCKKEATRIMSDCRDGYCTGWLPAGATYEAVSADCCTDDLQSYCDHCNRVFGELV